MSSSILQYYRVRLDDTITLKITIGHGQSGDTIVHLGANRIVDGQQGSFELVLLGVGEELNYKKLHCFTAVTDIQTETNETSVRYELIGGVEPYQHTLQETVNAHGDVEFYLATFVFYI